MKEKNIRKYLLQGIVFMSISIFFLLSYVLIQSKNVASEIRDNNLTYVSYEILTDNVVSVIGVNPSGDLIKPYKNERVTIGKYYYNYDDPTNQEKSITYYENTYIQNTGVDYVCNDIFEVYAIADGKVISVTEDDITGKTVKIQHNNELISVYQSLSDVVIEENAQVEKGQVIASSGTNKFNSDLGNHLHFELYKNNKLIDPEKYLNENIGKY